MLKPFLIGAFLSLAGLAWAEPVAVLAHPSETIEIQSRAGTLTVSFATEQDRLNVTMWITDDNGDTLRSRISLADNQTHTVIVREEETDLPTRFMIERAGQYVGVHLIETDDAPLLVRR